MNITLTPEQTEFLQSQLASGRFHNTDEVINTALKLLEQQEQHLDQLRQKVEIGTEQIQNGQVIDGETVFATLQAKLDRLSQSNP